MSSLQARDQWSTTRRDDTDGGRERKAHLQEHGVFLVTNTARWFDTSPALHDRPDHSPGSSSTLLLPGSSWTDLFHPCAVASGVPDNPNLSSVPLPQCRGSCNNGTDRTSKLSDSALGPSTARCRPDYCVYHIPIFQKCKLGRFNAGCCCRILVSTGPDRE